MITVSRLTKADDARSKARRLNSRASVTTGTQRTKQDVMSAGIIGFILGAIFGATCGVMALAILISGRDEDDRQKKRDYK